MSFLPKLEIYNVQQGKWPCSGRHILSQFDDSSIIVYQMVSDQTRNTSEKKCDRTKGDKEQSQNEDKDLNGNEENSKRDSSVQSRCETEESEPRQCETKATTHHQYGTEASVLKQRKTKAKMSNQCEKEATVTNHCDTKETVFSQCDTELNVPKDLEAKTEVSSQCETETHIYENLETGVGRKTADNELQSEDFVRLQTSFLRTMISSEWGRWCEHGKILAVRMKREGFEELLRVYVDDIKNNQVAEKHYMKSSTAYGCTLPSISKLDGSRDLKLDTEMKAIQGDVTVEWNPDRSPTGERLKRFVPEIGIRGHMLKQFNNVWTIRVKDISEYVRHLRRSVDTGRAMMIWTPVESVFSPGSLYVCSSLAIGRKASDVIEDNNEVKGMEQVCETLAEVYAHVSNSNVSLSPSRSREAILYLYGAFNPVHNGHVNALVESKRWLETEGNFHVCDVRIAVVSDDNIKGKFAKSGDLCIKFEHRFKLCEIACSDYPWINIHPVPVISQVKVGEQIRQEIRKPAATLAVLLGSDRAVLSKRKVKQKRSQNRMILCIGRKGMAPADLVAFKDAETNDPKRSLEFFVVPTEFNDISSTLIRKKLNQVIGANSTSTQVSKNSIFKEMTEKGWIRKEQGEYILQHLDNMFL